MTNLGIPGVGDGTLIASGGSALVYEALADSGERLAIKVLRGVRGNEVSRRFDREQSAAERLAGHPNIIRIYHAGLSSAGEPYLVMPLMAGGSLSDELDRQGAFPLHQATADVATAADALEFAHSRGVLHRDIKPGNLLRSDDGSIIVTDFGIARVVNAGISSATVGASTPLYAAPEILAENDASVRSEVYGLGALLYALLAGQAAFSDSENLWGTIHRIRTEVPAPIAGVPVPVMRVIQQAMAKAPSERPASAGLFRDNLRVALTSNNDWMPPPASSAELSQSPTAQVAAPSTTRVDQPLPPPVPAFSRRAPAVGSAPRRESNAAKVIAAVAALALVAGAAWFGTSRLLGGDGLPEDTAIAPPVDNSLPSPELDRDAPANDGGQNVSPDDLVGDPDDAGATIEDLEPAETIGDTFVSFNGGFFSALFPEGWSVVSSDVDEGYGFRSTFVADGMYLNVDTTPKEQRDSSGDIAQSARDIASGIRSASQVRTEEVDGLVMHSFTFRNSQGLDSIDIFFEVDGDGYAVVAGSAADPDTAFATARLVALSIRSNPDT